MRTLAFAALIAGALFAAPAQTFTGIVSDRTCAHGGHASMRMGPTDAECAQACVDVHGDAWVLVIGEHDYILSDQRAAETFAARKVTVVGTLDDAARTIKVESMSAAE